MAAKVTCALAVAAVFFGSAAARAQYVTTYSPVVYQTYSPVVTTCSPVVGYSSVAAYYPVATYSPVATL